MTNVYNVQYICEALLDTEQGLTQIRISDFLQLLSFSVRVDFGMSLLSVSPTEKTTTCIDT